jgi:hypothetical protein
LTTKFAILVIGGLLMGVVAALKIKIIDAAAINGRKVRVMAIVPRGFDS